MAPQILAILRYPGLQDSFIRSSLQGSLLILRVEAILGNPHRTRVGFPFVDCHKSINSKFIQTF